MNTNYFAENNISAGIFNPQKNFLPADNNAEIPKPVTGLIRFEEKKEQFIWAHPDEIIFVKSADHYVKALISCGKQKKWMSRHCTIKDLLASLPSGNFIRLNKFYLLNRNHFLRFSETGKVLFFDGDFSVPVSHGISRYILDLFKK